MLSPTDLPDVDVADAWLLIASARSIAPCLDSLEGDSLAIALAILTRAAAELPKAGSRRVRSQSRNGTSVTFDGFTSVFSADERAVLRGLCGHVSPAAIPVGEFPAGGLIDENWPER